MLWPRSLKFIKVLMKRITQCLFRPLSYLDLSGSILDWSGAAQDVQTVGLLAPLVVVRHRHPLRHLQS